MARHEAFFFGISASFPCLDSAGRFIAARAYVRGPILTLMSRPAAFTDRGRNGDIPMSTARNLILAAAATAGLVAVSLPATASADCYYRRGDRAAGTVLGAVIGGGLGSSLAHGSSRGAGTVAGAILA